MLTILALDSLFLDEEVYYHFPSLSNQTYTHIHVYIHQTDCFTWTTNVGSNQCDKYYGTIQGVPIKNNPLAKMLYFSHGSMDLSQTFRLFD